MLVFSHGVSNLFQLFLHGILHLRMVMVLLGGHLTELIVQHRDHLLLVADLFFATIVFFIKSLEDILVRLTFARDPLYDLLCLGYHVTFHKILLLEL